MFKLVFQFESDISNIRTFLWLFHFSYIALQTNFDKESLLTLSVKFFGFIVPMDFNREKSTNLIGFFHTMWIFLVCLFLP